MSVARRARLVAALAVTALLAPSVALADPPDPVEDAQEAEASTATRIAELERQLAELAAARDQAGIAAGLATEAYLVAADRLAEAQAETREARRAAEAAADDVEEARASLGVIAQLLYQGGSASLATLTPFLSADNLEVALDSATYMDQLATRTDGELERFEALRTVAEILQERAARADAAEEDAVESLAAAAETAQANADAAAFQLAYSTEQRDALITQLAAQRATTVELERSRQDALEAERIERENLAAIREAQAVAAVDSLAADTVETRELAVSRDVDRATTEAGTPTVAVQAAPSTSPTTTTPVPAPTTPAPAPATPAPAPTTVRPTTPVPAPTTPAPAPTTVRPTTPAPAPTTPAPAPTTVRPTTPAPAPTTPAPAPTTPAPAPTTPAPAPTTPPPPPPPAAPAPLPAAQVALNFALSQVGKPYIWGATGPDGYDCSGLTQTSYRRAGISLSRTTKAQYAETSRVPLASMKPGDLIFYSSNGAASGIYHVAIYAGNGMRVHAPSPGKYVEHVKMYYGNILPYAGRVTG